MKYTQIGSGAQYPYPDANIDPEKKGLEYCMAYAKAAWHDWSFSYPKGVFANNGGDYEKFRMYAMGKQPNSPYKKLLGVDQQTNNTWLVNDWSIRSVVSTYRDKAIARMMEQELGIVATPIDMMAKSELDKFYSHMKAKLAVRKLMQGVNQDLAAHPMISLESGDPMDIEELEMRVELGEQFNRSKDAELAIELGFFENDYKFFRRGLYEDLFDYGIAGYKEWLGDDNKAKFRKINPNSIIINYCRQANFSDLVHAGELIDVPLIELATATDKEGNPMFTEKELQEFAGSLAGKWGNPTMIGAGTGWFKPYDKFKCKVLDLEFLSYNDYVYRNSIDGSGNSDFRKSEFGRGKKSDKYIRKRIQVVYKVKWVVGTDKVYDYGLCYDPKRSVNNEKKAKTSLSYKFCAYNFYEMKAQGFMERLIPYLDDYQLTMLKIQNWKNRAVPSGWWINLDALENVALTKGGAAMQPKELLEMFFQTGVLVGRVIDAQGNPLPGNVQPVISMQNSMMSELIGFYNDLTATIQAIEKMTGYNDITSGEGNPKTLVPGYEMANISTQHALYPMTFAEKYLTEKLAEDVLCRMQQGVRKGGISGYAPALNTNTLRFIQVSPVIGTREYGIMLQERTTDEQKMWILQQVNADIANGFLDTSDAILVINTHNAKQAMSILSYKVKKAKEAAAAQKMQELQMQNEGGIQAAKIAQDGKLTELDMEWHYKMQEKQMEIMGELKKEEMRLQAQLQMKSLELGVKQNMNTELADAKVEAAEVAADAKVISAHVQRDADIVTTDLAGYHAKEKQRLQNEKPTSSTKK